MWSDGAVLAASLACLVVGAIVGAVSVYAWLLKNSNGVDDEDFSV